MSTDFDPPKPLPSEWQRQNSFTDFERSNPMAPKPGVDLDASFDKAAQAIRDTQFRLRMLQSDDGSLRNQIVGLDQLAPDAILGYERPEPWTPETEYSDRAAVFFEYSMYFSTQAHTSGTNFENDRDVSGYWKLAYDFTQVVQDAIEARDQAEQFAEDSEQARDESREARDQTVTLRDETQDLRDEVRKWLDMLVERSPTVYVAEYGDDNQPGTNPKQPVRTLAKAIEIVSQYGGVKTIFLKTGNYDLNNPVRLPPWTAVLGDTLRTTFVNVQNKQADAFQLDNGCYLSEFSFRGLELDDTENPTKGFGAVFAPGAFITTSPYVQNCSAITNRPPDALYKPLAPANANPAVGPGGGGMLCDPTVLDPYSPLKSMIVDAYTQVQFNGIGVLARKGGFVQMVSFFTNFTRYGCLAESGGHIVLLNSNTTFGDYGLVARGSRNVVEVDMSFVDYPDDPNAADLLVENQDFIAEEMWQRLVDNGDVPGWSTAWREATFTDGKRLIAALAQAVRYNDPSAVERFTQGLFDWNAEHHIPEEARPATLQSWTFLTRLARDVAINTPVTPSQSEVSQTFDTDNPGQQTVREQIQKLVDEVKANFQSPQTSTFGSLVVTTSHDFSYAGSGVNFMALPAQQGGRGSGTDMSKAVVQEDGGRVFFTAGDESGDFHIGDGLTIRQATGTLEGRTFNQALFAQMTPFILALEGG